jgi:hypothetical protein
MNFKKFRGRIVRHKYITKPRPTTMQKDAVKIFYLCNQAVEAEWKKTDISGRKVNCKNCKRQMKKGDYKCFM